MAAEGHLTSSDDRITDNPKISFSLAREQPIADTVAEIQVQWHALSLRPVQLRTSPGWGGLLR